MKKYIWLVFSMLIIPCLLCVAVCAVCPTLSIGQGEGTMANCRMGKDVLVELGGLYKRMDVEEYTLGILAGVVDPDYDMEMLKLQAVLVRTNLLKEMEEQGTKDAEDLSFQYLSMEEREEMWGRRDFERYEKRLERAVIDTAGKVLEKEGNLILACYHEVSIGKTASAKEILDEDISYLQSVESGWDVEAKHYMNLVNLTWEEVQNCIKDADAQVADRTEGAQEDHEAASTEQEEDKTTNTETVQDTVDIEIIENTEHGFVKKIRIGDREYTGQEAMDLLGLPSLNYYVEKQDGGVRFVCLGKGNNLGVSQYGANCMAKDGKTMEEILQYYYKDVSLTTYQSDV